MKYDNGYLAYKMLYEPTIETKPSTFTSSMLSRINNETSLVIAKNNEMIAVAKIFNCYLVNGGAIAYKMLKTIDEWCGDSIEMVKIKYAMPLFIKSFEISKGNVDEIDKFFEYRIPEEKGLFKKKKNEAICSLNNELDKIVNEGLPRCFKLTNDVIKAREFFINGGECKDWREIKDNLQLDIDYSMFHFYVINPGFCYRKDGKFVSKKIQKRG